MHSADKGWLLPFVIQSGAVQMATDDWMLERVRAADAPAAILRFYQWSQPTLSLGFHQKTRSLPASLPNLDIVRRPTGGRAVLHQATGERADLTYSLAIANARGSRHEVYQQLCEFLIRGVATLGVELEFGMAGRGYAGEASCFRTATSADLCWQGRKVIGSAQLWRGSAVLQHGTILLDPDRAIWDRVLPGSSQRVVGLTEAGTEPFEISKAIACLIES
ncbi:MAG: lipoate--protein ligase family protein, partial [Cyanobacteria bacterium J06639_1]